ncbi:MAG: AbrB/MazE/SpoVT family DNA-binding domain-containing protein [Oscillospiraceae bacterium]|nr:AbrB/MazE/SpoVT family DNA-binding domain-containing protein [Oscillospiraceae bacterium]
MKMKMPKDKFLSTVRMGDKGQIVIPKEVREMFEIEPGDNLMLLADKDRGIAIVAFDGMMDFMNEATRQAMGQKEREQ